MKVFHFEPISAFSCSTFDDVITCCPFFPLQTDYEGQAKKLMELMEHTDILVVAGGDGTLQEVVTGLLRRPDQVGVALQDALIPTFY